MKRKKNNFLMLFYFHRKYYKFLKYVFDTRTYCKIYFSVKKKELQKYLPILIVLGLVSLSKICFRG